MFFEYVVVLERSAVKNSFSTYVWSKVDSCFCESVYIRRHISKISLLSYSRYLDSIALQNISTPFSSNSSARGDPVLSNICISSNLEQKESFVNRGSEDEGKTCADSQNNSLLAFKFVFILGKVIFLFLLWGTKTSWRYLSMNTE